MESWIQNQEANSPEDAFFGLCETAYENASELMNAHEAFQDLDIPLQEIVELVDTLFPPIKTDPETD